MRRLWAVWRMPYIKLLASEGEKECIFCTLPREGRDRDNLILYRSKLSFIILNKYPYNPGHLMVAPYRHVANLDELEDREVTDVMKLLRLSIRILKRAMSPEGFNIGMNIGKVAGAGFEGHIHIHVVPRWVGDANFMPILSNTKVISEALSNTYDELKKVLDGVGRTE
ncbi:MAG: HIT domain-containing protein [Candidatus Korarchaeum sp.]|nr:HIT domain-containing protein [Candidatus Korarchaeum sp.]